MVKKAAKRKVVRKTSDRNLSVGNGLGVHSVAIPKLKQEVCSLLLIGDRPLMVNNKLNVAEMLDKVYNNPGGKTSAPAPDKLPPDEMYANCFYVMPGSKYDPPHSKGRYGVPTSGIKKCVCSAIRTTGITDNTTIGLISKSFWVMEDAGGLCELQGKFERDVRPVNIGSGVKTVPQMRHRPIWNNWRIKIIVKYNAKVLGPDQLVNLFMHAGQYIGLCELRAEKKQGACGGFVVDTIRK